MTSVFQTVLFSITGKNRLFIGRCFYSDLSNEILEWSWQFFCIGSVDKMALMTLVRVVQWGLSSDQTTFVIAIQSFQQTYKITGTLLDCVASHHRHSITTLPSQPSRSTQSLFYFLYKTHSQNTITHSHIADPDQNILYLTMWSFDSNLLINSVTFGINKTTWNNHTKKGSIDYQEYNNVLINMTRSEHTFYNMKIS